MCTGFTIATLRLAGGGRLGISPLPGRFNDLLADVAAIARWDPQVVVSMTEQTEMAQHGAGHLGEALAQAGIAWHHLPIPDFSGPTAQAAAAWPALSARLHAVLDAGGGVLVHCRGGYGRSGMAVLRLLVERGEAPEAALSRLRAARPGAVEAQP